MTWNSRAPLLGCLQSLEKAARGGDLEVIVIDNASSDDTLDAVKIRAPWVTVIANGTNRGLAAANNQGLVAARGTHLVISNPDIVYEPDTIPEMLAALDRHPRAAFIIPQLLFEDGTIQTSVGDLPTLREALVGRTAVRERGGTRGYWWDGWDHQDETTVAHGAEACFLIRRDALASIGAVDENFFLDWEGIDWSARAGELGWEIWFAPRARVVHLGGQSIRQAQLPWVLASHRGMYRYFMKRSPRWQRPMLAAAVTARGVAKAVLVGAGTPLYDRARAEPK